MPPIRYAIRITEANIALIRVLSPLHWNLDVKEDQNRYFLFTIDSPRTTTEHDVTDDLAAYEDIRETNRIVIQ